MEEKKKKKNNFGKLIYFKNFLFFIFFYIFMIMDFAYNKWCTMQIMLVMCYK